MPERDDFLERLRNDAAPLRHQPDEATLARIRERIHARLERPGVIELLARWLRPVAAAAAAVTIAVTVGYMTLARSQGLSVVDAGVEISLAGETYRVGY